VALKDLPAEEVSRRYRTLYTAAVSDVLDSLGLRSQTLPHYIAPLTLDMVVAGPAFTCQGYPARDTASDDSHMRIRMVDTIKPGTVSVWATGGHLDSGHWGEIMSNAARERDCRGVVVDGGLRDTRFVVRMGFPVFCRFRSPAGSIGRWEIREWMVPIRIGQTLIKPDDFVFGDADGVVVIPRELTTEVLLRTEEIVGHENDMRADLARGVTVSEVYRKHGKF
jgi:regulator of RNase E activity RraA